MLTLIIKSYITILISVGAFSLFIFLLGLMWIARTKKPDKKINTSPPNEKTIESPIKARAASTPYDLTSENTVSVKDIESIAGEDKIATQLDLARAYIETGQVSLAKKILTLVLKQGTDHQKKEAQQLLMSF